MTPPSLIRTLRGSCMGDHISCAHTKYGHFFILPFRSYIGSHIRGILIIWYFFYFGRIVGMSFKVFLLLERKIFLFWTPRKSSPEIFGRWQLHADRNPRQLPLLSWQLPGIPEELWWSGPQENSALICIFGTGSKWSFWTRSDDRFRIFFWTQINSNTQPIGSRLYFHPFEIFKHKNELYIFSWRCSILHEWFVVFEVGKSSFGV